MGTPRYREDIRVVRVPLKGTRRAGIEKKGL